MPDALAKIPPDPSDSVTLGGKRYEIAALPISMLKKLIRSIMANNQRPPVEQIEAAADTVLMVINSLDPEATEETVRATVPEIQRAYDHLLRISGLVLVSKPAGAEDAQPGESPAAA